MTVEAVLNHHLRATGAGDIDALMEDYTESSILMTPDSTLVGLAEIRGLFEVLITRLLPPESTIEIQRQDIQGDVAYIVWKADSPTTIFFMATDTFIVRDGKIATQTFAAQMMAK